MITIYPEGGYFAEGSYISPAAGAAQGFTPAAGREKTMAYGIMKAHNVSGDMAHLKMRFDAMASHDITYVGTVSYTHLTLPTNSLV